MLWAGLVRVQEFITKKRKLDWLTRPQQPAEAFPRKMQLYASGLGLIVTPTGFYGAAEFSASPRACIVRSGRAQIESKMTSG